MNTINLNVEIEEASNRESSWTYNKQFDEDGYLKVENLYNPKELFSDVPKLRGQLNYFDKKNKDIFHHIYEETQVNGSVSRYNYPQYRVIHNKIKKKVENIIGRELYTTYFFDRFYFSGQELKKHTDRGSCEISVSVHVDTNLPDNLKEWPFKIKSGVGDERSIILNSGDGVLYKGCERPHWRDPMPSPKNKLFLGKIIDKEYYYHQIFFHYVLADGKRCQHAWDFLDGDSK